MPIKNLKLNKTGGLELEVKLLSILSQTLNSLHQVVKRKFADDPADAPGTTKKYQSKAEELSHQLAQSLDEGPIKTDEDLPPYNPVTANHYEVITRNNSNSQCV